MSGSWAEAPVQATGYLLGSVCTDGCCFLLVAQLAGDVTVDTGKTALSPHHLDEWRLSTSFLRQLRGILLDHTGPGCTSLGAPSRSFQLLKGECCPFFSSVGSRALQESEQLSKPDCRPLVTAFICAVSSERA